jgi:uncharacterized protein DUF6702
MGLNALLLVAAWLVHPLHTSLAEVRYDASGSEVQISLRVFAEDFADAVRTSQRLSAATPVGEEATMAYVARTFVLMSGDRTRVPLAWCGVRREGDLSWICLRGRSPGAKDLRLTNRVLVERFDDQINIVQVELEGRRTSYLFTARDGTRTLF